jgi:hydrogenase nickel incorporation protein HypB
MNIITVDKDPRSADQLIADEIRREMRERKILMINLISSPGSGKTTLLEKALPPLQSRVRLAVIEADNATTNDADRLQAIGAKVEPVCTGVTSCHLSAVATRKAIAALGVEGLELLVVENVGNLVCPAEEDIGEDYKIAVLSVAEGEDKPLKYPLCFQEASLVLLNKIDAAVALGADTDLMERNVRATNPKVEVLRVSARTGEGVAAFVEWVVRRVRAKQT